MSLLFLVFWIVLSVFNNGLYGKWLVTITRNFGLPECRQNKANTGARGAAYSILSLERILVNGRQFVSNQVLRASAAMRIDRQIRKASAHERIKPPILWFLHVCWRFVHPFQNLRNGTDHFIEAFT